MRKYLHIMIIISAFVGVLLSVYLEMFKGEFSFFRGFSMFKYFTIQSNTLVGVFFLLLFLPKTKEYHLVRKMIGGVTVYITITFVIFIFLLQATYHPTGWNILTNILLHYVTPVLVLIFMGVFKLHIEYDYSDIFKWMVYPVLYVVFIIIHGVITTDYLYPFFQIPEVGISGFILMVVFLIGFFVGLSFITMKILSKRETVN